MNYSINIRFALLGMASSAAVLAILKLLGADSGLVFAGTCLAWYASGVHFIRRPAMASD